MQTAAVENSNKGAVAQKPQQGGPPKRQLKNFLLLQSFQLKYTGIIVVISSILCAGMGYVIYQRTQEAYHQTRLALASAQDANEQAKAANEEARAASEMLKLEQLADPEAAKSAVESKDSKFAIAALEMEQKAAAMKAKAGDMERASKYTIWYLGGLMGFLVLSLAIFGIVITHRVAGPLFVMGRFFNSIAQGDFRLQKRALRKGDELGDIFQRGVDAVQSLNNSTREDLGALENTLRVLSRLREAGADPQVIRQVEEDLRKIAQRKARALGQEMAA